MSADDEIVALKASGVSIWQIVAPGLVLSIILSAIGVWIGLYVSPEFRFASEKLRWQAVSTSPLALIEPGRMTKISKTTSIRVGSRDDHGLLHDVHLMEIDKAGKVLKDITAARGLIEVASEERQLQLILEDFTITELALDENGISQQPSKGSPVFLAAEKITIPLEFGTLEDRKPLERKLKLMPIGMLFGDIALQEQRGNDTTEHWLEFHQRLALAFSPLGFLLLGIPFGIRHRRSESSVGIIICVGISLVFYGFMLLADSLVDHPKCHPELIIWLPNLLYEFGGLWALVRMSRN